VNLKAVVFDFGGTLDTNGIHWSEKFREAYTAFNLNIYKEDFREAFVWASRNAGILIKPDSLLKRNLSVQLALQKEFLSDKYSSVLADSNIVDELTSYCYREVLRNIKISEPVLENLKKTYKLALVSNYFGNITTVLKELSIFEYFDSIIDSTEVNVRKPDPRIFEFALNELNVKPFETVVAGDSYKNDIAPAKTLGCHTVWIKVKGWEETGDISCADRIISSIEMLPEEIRKIR
jgi:putative hydrolase of the HAD superfamily